MANDTLPQTVVVCDGCGEDLNILAPYLYMMLKAQREVLISDEATAADPNDVPEANIYLGVKSGRGVLKRFHNFACQLSWVEERKDLNAKLEYHAEDEIYVPEDNPTEEELAARAAAEGATGEEEA